MQSANSNESAGKRSRAGSPSHGPLSLPSTSPSLEERRYGARTVTRSNSVLGAISWHDPKRSRSKIGAVDRSWPVHTSNEQGSPC